jgi:hypothetical protein
MQNDWALENLQVIRTLMESSAVYRRALAPVMGLVGVTGIVAGILGTLLKFQTPRVFVVYWIVVAFLCLTWSLFLIRRQALKVAEPFWSPPARRVAQAVLPAFCTALLAAILYCFLSLPFFVAGLLLVPAWMVLYGLAMYSAGFFMPRGIKLFGTGFILAGFIVFGVAWHGNLDLFRDSARCLIQANWIMAAVFGGGHAAYGLYLHFTEMRGNVA